MIFKFASVLDCSTSNMISEASPFHLQAFGNNHYVVKVFLQQLPMALTPSAAEVMESDDLLQEILLRLPAQSLIKFKLVAKRWLGLISEPRLSQSWRAKSVAGLFFVTKRYSDYPTYNFIPLNNEMNTGKIFHFKRLKTTDNPCGISIVQSCNGLLLCCSNYHNRRVSSCNYYIYNPTTNQMRTLPPLQHCDKKMTTGICLAFDPIKSSHYKVIRLCTHEKSWDTHQFEVFSSKTGTWRPSGDPFLFDNLILHDGVYWRGKIVWLSLRTESFFSYDVDKKQFGEMPKPAVEDKWRHYKIKYFNEWRGHLNFIRYSNTGKMQIYVFEFEEDQSHWFLKYHIDGEKFLRSHPHFFQNPFRPNYRYFLSVLSFVHGESLEDSYLVLYIPGHVVAYCFKDEKIRKLGDLMLDFDDQHALSTLGWADVHQYIETFSHV